jgi:beta-galactosidase
VLKVVAYRNGKKWAVAEQHTAREATRLGLDADRQALRADGRDLSFVTVSIRDRHDNLVPRANAPICFALTGPGEIIAVDNGDPTSHEPFQATTRRAFNGLALVVVRSKAGRGGRLVLTARSHGLARATLALTATPSR